MTERLYGKGRNMRNQQTVDRFDLKGVAGWLLFFCIVTTIFVPIRNMYGALFVPYTDAIGVAVAVILSLYAIATGIVVWTQRPSGATVAKVFLIITFSLDLVGILLEQASGELQASPSDARIYVQGMISSVVWLLYFLFSKRVRVTFPPKEDRVANETLEDVPSDEDQETVEDRPGTNA